MMFLYPDLVDMSALGDGPLAPNMRAPDGIGGMDPPELGLADTGGSIQNHWLFRLGELDRPRSDRFKQTSRRTRKTFYRLVTLDLPCDVVTPQLTGHRNPVAKRGPGQLRFAGLQGQTSLEREEPRGSARRVGIILSLHQHLIDIDRHHDPGLAQEIAQAVEKADAEFPSLVNSLRLNAEFAGAYGNHVNG
jgi:hypothetical protein